MDVFLITIRRYVDGEERPIWNKPTRAYTSERGAKSAYTQICNEYRQSYYRGMAYEVHLYHLSTLGTVPVEVTLIPSEGQ